MNLQLIQLLRQAVPLPPRWEQAQFWLNILSQLLQGSFPWCGGMNGMLLLGKDGTVRPKVRPHYHACMQRRGDQWQIRHGIFSTKK